jgi:hypothetical protein
VNTAEPFFVLAQGGGGGGGSGNINTSSITFVSSLTFVDSDVPPSTSIIRAPMVLSVVDDETTLQVNSTDGGSGYAFWLTCPSPATGPRGLITCRNPSGGGGLQDMGINAFSLTISTTTSVSIPTNLTVSSINGAAAVSASEVSTLQGQVAALMLLAGL